MANVENGDILRVGATWAFEEDYEVTNVWHMLVQAGGGIDFAAASLDIADYMEDIYTEMLVELSNAMITDFLTLSNVTQALTFGAFAWQSELQGASEVGSTAPGVCLFAWARTLVPRVQIRKYLGIFTENSVSAGKWSAGSRLGAQGAMDIHITPYSAGPALTLQGVAYNRALDTHTLPLSATTSSEPAYQRRRRRGRGS
jgi:hypothetical protein